MMADAPAMMGAALPGLLSRGKVRDVHALDRNLLIIATDRISAFDVVMNDLVPGKGELLTRMSRFWLETLPACTPHHLLYVVDASHVPTGLEAHVAALAGRAMVVRRAQVLPIECVVRGYLAGGGWREYRECGAVSGVVLPAGLRLAEQLPEPIFTPSTKAAHGHDEAIDLPGAVAHVARHMRLSTDEAQRLVDCARDRALAIYRQAAAHAASRGILLADTKFEFGLCDGQLILIDEVLTPDSSRFWPADAWQAGVNPPSYDKQFLRDYLESIPWNKQPPPPPLPAEVLSRTAERYRRAYDLLTRPG